jgi:hypothetical protein
MGRATHNYAGIASLGNINAKAEIKSYAQAKAFLGDDREKIVASNVTIVAHPDKSISVRLYDTDIITYYPDETFSWTNGGFNTPTTANRATQFGPAGYSFYHHKKILCCGGKAESPDLRLPVVPPNED